MGEVIQFPTAEAKKEDGRKNETKLFSTDFQHVELEELEKIGNAARREAVMEISFLAAEEASRLETQAANDDNYAIGGNEYVRATK